MSTDSEESGATVTKRIQFGGAQQQSSSSSSSSTKSEESVSSEEEEEEFENVNARLRHQMPAMPISAGPATTLHEVAALVYIAVLKQCLHEIIILREMNRMSPHDVTIHYVPLTEKYNNAEYEIDVVINSDEKFLVYKKFRTDISWLEKVLKVTIGDMQRTFDFQELKSIMHDEELIRQEEKTLLASKEFNKRELAKLRNYIDMERTDLTRGIQEITERIGRAKDELNDFIADSLVKIGYIKQWQRSRMEQNERVLGNKEESLIVTARKMLIESEKELRIHEELWSYLNVSMEEYRLDIEKWMDKYDKDLDYNDQQLQALNFELEKQRNEYTLLQEEYEKRQEKIDAYKVYRIKKQKEAEELQRRTKACTKIQAWWRGVMYRNCLGPYRKKKGKGKKNKNSAKKKKK